MIIDAPTIATYIENKLNLNNNGLRFRIGYWVNSLDQDYIQVDGTDTKVVYGAVTQPAGTYRPVPNIETSDESFVLQIYSKVEDQANVILALNNLTSLLVGKNDWLSSGSQMTQVVFNMESPQMIRAEVKNMPTFIGVDEWNDSNYYALSQVRIYFVQSSKVKFGNEFQKYIGMSITDTLETYSSSAFPKTADALYDVNDMTLTYTSCTPSTGTRATTIASLEADGVTFALIRKNRGEYILAAQGEGKVYPNQAITITYVEEYKTAFLTDQVVVNLNKAWSKLNAFSYSINQAKELQTFQPMGDNTAKSLASSNAVIRSLTLYYVPDAVIDNIVSDGMQGQNQNTIYHYREVMSVGGRVLPDIDVLIASFSYKGDYGTPVTISLELRKSV